jgi:cyanophycinase
MRLRSIACALMLGTAACAGTPRTAAEPSPSRGTLFIVGGGAQPKELVQDFVNLAGGAGRARIAVLPMASEEAESGGKEKAEELRGFGAQAFVLNVTHAQAMTDSAARLLDSVTGVWFGGGDQQLLTAAIGGTPVQRAILARYRAGAVIGGTSAGAAVMSDSMITGNQRRPEADSVGYYGDEYPNITRGAIQIVPGLGLLHGAIVDMHFIRRERANRLLAAVLERPSLVGVGIDEGTAVRVDPDGRWTILGRSAALVVDARAAHVVPATAPRLGASSIKVDLLPSGSTYDPRTGRATLPGQ